MRQRMTDDFQDTRPIREHQERLHAQWGRPRAHYRPNHVPALRRMLVGLVSATWVCWALIGLLSGHMFFLLLWPPLHFTGLPALVFSAAVLASAAACFVVIVDHHDKRDNERTYRQVRHKLWWLSGGLGLLTLAVATAEHLGLLPFSTPNVGLMSVERLVTLAQYPPLQRWLSSHHDSIPIWFGVTAAWCLIGLALFKKLGWLEVERTTALTHSGVMIATMSLVLPALVTFSLFLLDQLAMGHLADTAESAEDLRESVVFTLTTLLACLGAAGYCMWLLVASAMVQLGWLRAPYDV
ncbi:hypothetical protein DBR42_29505 [Pelomonas sp. HMWF004]|nr:hypothetical protein DBR42_29505 [Pelomonas sp. HMWF004]